MTIKTAIRVLRVAKKLAKKKKVNVEIHEIILNIDGQMISCKNVL